ncbi:MAG TPA: ribbon-helix-helix domain-containing protein [Sphingobium sp.]|nr:ribbon-helix-helix domain-containing protein [Sphingobium sp.]
MERDGALQHMDKAPPPCFAPPVKRSITIAGHATSISLEPLFWRALEERARADGLPLSALVGRIDAGRIAAADPPNLASAIRCWLLAAASARPDAPLS